MQKNPEIAVLLATYNGELFLKQQLDSILSQTYKNFKIYISDDNSTDKTEEILVTYKAHYPDQIFYFVNNTNLGFVKNFEKLLQSSKNNYIAFCDQDDIWQENKLEVEMAVMLKLEAFNPKRACLVHSDLIMINENAEVIYNSYFRYRKYKLKNSKDLGHILGPCGVMGNTMLINKKLRDLVLPFPETLDVHDYWIAVNCELFGLRKTIFEPLVQYRIHNDNSSNSKKRLANSFLNFSRDIKLPNLDTNRKIFLTPLSTKITSVSDRVVFDAYLEYLKFQKNRFVLYVNLLKYSLVKRDTFFRIKLFFKMYFTKRY